MTTSPEFRERGIEKSSWCRRPVTPRSRRPVHTSSGNGVVAYPYTTGKPVAALGAAKYRWAYTAGLLGGGR
ncbi:MULTISPECIES: hypothetical protein [Streptomyces]|uniref:hypothetical protein n=1 Tax=Streptomyces TaxID=1883 RepID=UPI0035A1301B